MPSAPQPPTRVKMLLPQAGQGIILGLRKASSGQNHHPVTGVGRMDSGVALVIAGPPSFSVKGAGVSLWDPAASRNWPYPDCEFDRGRGGRAVREPGAPTHHCHPGGWRGRLWSTCQSERLTSGPPGARQKASKGIACRGAGSNQPAAC